MLEEVHEREENWRIRARVARLWEHHGGNKYDVLVWLHMVLVHKKDVGYVFHVFCFMSPVLGWLC